jgi:predicted DNA-binding transcriptional regulator AlpA
MRLITSKQLRDEKGIPHGDRQLDRLSHANKFPQPVKLGNRRAWIEGEIDVFLKGLVSTRDAGKASA